MKSSVSREKSINTSKPNNSLFKLSSIFKNNKFNLKKSQSLGKSSDIINRLKKPLIKGKGKKEMTSPKTIEYSKS